MTVLTNKYIGLSHPITEIKDRKHKDLILNAWKISNCPQGYHLFDEVFSDDHYLHCDACGIEVHIKKIVIPDGK